MQLSGKTRRLGINWLYLFTFSSETIALALWEEIVVRVLVY